VKYSGSYSYDKNYKKYDILIRFLFLQSRQIMLQKFLKNLRIKNNESRV